jgi:hypothetical protein
VSKKESTESKEVEAKEPVEESTEEIGLTDPKEIEEALGIFDETNEDEDEEKSKGEKEESEEKSKEKPEKESEESEEEAKESDEGTEEEKESKDEDEEKSDEESKEEKKPKEPKPDDPATQVLKDELEIANKRYADSTREFETKYKPMEEENTRLKSQMEYTADIIASDPELSAKFLKAAEDRGEASAAPKPAVDEETKAELKALKDKLDSLEKETNAPKEKARVDAIMAFEKEHEGLTNEERSTLGATAGVLQDKLGLSDKEALDRAWMVIHPEEATKAAADKAEKEARVNQAKKEKATSEKSPAASGASTTVSLTAEEKIVAKKFGMSEDDYAAMKK